VRNVVAVAFELSEDILAVDQVFTATQRHDIDFIFLGSFGFHLLFVRLTCFG
jgi:hypothetical protein